MEESHKSEDQFIPAFEEEHYIWMDNIRQKGPCAARMFPTRQTLHLNYKYVNGTAF